MKNLFVFVLVFFSININAQWVTPVYYNKCDLVGMMGSYYYGQGNADTCTWNVIQKCDTCTQLVYDCAWRDTCHADSSVYFIGTGGIFNYGTTSTFNFIHRTGIFRIELELKYNWSTGTLPIFTNTVTTVNGIYLNTANGTTLNLYMRSNNAVILNTSWTNCLINYIPGSQSLYADNVNKITLVGDGTGVTLYVGHGDTLAVNYGKKNYTGSIVNTGISAFPLSLCRTNNAGSNHTETYIRFVKVYTSSDQSALYAYFPLNSNVNPASELLLGLTGTISSNYTANVGRCAVYKPCVAQGWRTIVLNEVEDTVKVSLNSLNKPITLYFRGEPTNPNGLPIWYLYMLIVPKTTPVKLAKKLIGNKTLLVSTIRHNIYSYELAYEDISSTTPSNHTPIPTTIMNDTSKMVLKLPSDTAYWAHLEGDTLLWSSNDNWGSLPGWGLNKDSIGWIIKPITNTDLIYYYSNGWTASPGQHFPLRWFSPVTGILYNKRISSWQ